LPVLLGLETVRLSASTITRLIRTWQDEYRGWKKRSLAGREQVSIRLDGLHFNVRLEKEGLACLVILGVTIDGNKEIVALEGRWIQWFRRGMM